MNSPARRSLAVAIVAFVFLDWMSKFWILNRIALGDNLPVIDGWLYIKHRQNTGVAFSLFADLPAPWGPVMLSWFSLIAVALFIRLMAESPDRIGRGATSLVIAGAIGNLGDRLANGSVTDFIFVPFFPFVFNVADAAITLGALVLVIRFALGAPPAGARTLSAGS